VHSHLVVVVVNSESSCGSGSRSPVGRPAFRVASGDVCSLLALPVERAPPAEIPWGRQPSWWEFRGSASFAGRVGT